MSSLQCPYADSSYQAVFLPPVPVSTFFFFRHACCSFLVLGEMMKHRFHNNQLSLGGRSLNPTAPPPAVPPRVSPSMVGSSATSKAPCNVNVNLYSKQNEKKTIAEFASERQWSQSRFQRSIPGLPEAGRRIQFVTQRGREETRRDGGHQRSQFSDWRSSTSWRSPSKTATIPGQTVIGYPGQIFFFFFF